MSIAGGKLHKEIMGMLSINEGAAMILLPGLKQDWKTAGCDRKRLQAQHSAQLQPVVFDRPACHQHKPVGGVELVVSPGSLLPVIVQKEIVVGHQAPAPGLAMHG